MSRFTKISVSKQSDLDQFPIVTDGVTGLMWDRRETEEMNHADALAYVAKLNAEKFGGYDDWKLPEHDELRSLIDLKKHTPATDTDAFPLCKDSWYWSSTAYAPSPSGYAWIVYFGTGSSLSHSRYLTVFVRACRSRQEKL